MKILVLVLLGILLIPLRRVIEKKIPTANRRLRRWSAMLRYQPKTIINFLSGFSYLWLWYVLFFLYISLIPPLKYGNFFALIVMAQAALIFLGLFIICRYYYVQRSVQRVHRWNDWLVVIPAQFQRLTV